MTIWFSSDFHFGHENIIRYCNRPFENAAIMDEMLVDLHNAYVKPSDHFYTLGDVTMERDGQGRGLEILARLNGHKRLIMGNHDHYAIKHYVKWFEKVMAMQMMDNIRFTHIPVHPGSMGRATANVHGHIHDQDSPAPHVYVDKYGKSSVHPYINISLERTNYHPLSFEEIKDLIRLEKDKYER